MIVSTGNAGGSSATSQFARILVGVFGVLLLAPEGSAAVPADIAARVQEIVDEEVTRSSTPGAAVAVVADGRVVASIVTGLADREAGHPVTRQTIFPAASVSKLLTATLVMRQVERGLLELDRPANDYLPPERWIRDSAGQPVGSTLRQLLSHSSGLPMFSGRTETNEAGSKRSLADYLAQGLHTVNAPGERLAYTNEAFALAGYLAAHVEGEDFEQHAQRVLLGPLGMSNSSFQVLDTARPKLAVLYGAMFDDNAVAERLDMSAVGPAASLHTTADDLARVALLHLGEGAVPGVRVLKPESVHEMMHLQARLHPRLPDGFGIGFAVLGAPERRMVWWDGAVPGAAARLALLPDHGVGVAILANSTSAVLNDTISRRIFDLLVGPVELPPIPDTSDEGDVTGDYRLVGILGPSQWYMEPFLLLSIARRDDHLEIGLPFIGGGPALRPLGSGRYRLSGIVDGATLLIEDDRLYALFLEGRRVSAFATSTAIAIYVGAFALLVLTVFGWGILLVVRRMRRAGA